MKSSKLALITASDLAAEPTVEVHRSLLPTSRWQICLPAVLTSVPQLCLIASRSLARSEEDHELNVVTDKRQQRLTEFQNFLEICYGQLFDAYAQLCGRFSH